MQKQCSTEVKKWMMGINGGIKIISGCANLPKSSALSLFVNLYRRFSMLSIDIAIGAGVSTLFFAHLFNVHLRIFPVVILILTVWMIYTVDHLIDVKKIDTQALSVRRRFHQSHERSMIRLTAVCLVTASFLTMFLYFEVFIGGVVLMILSLSYFLLKDRIKGIKEISCGLLYCCGILLAPVLNRVGAFTTADIEMIGVFIFTTILNLILFSYFDYRNDTKENQQSLTTLLGPKVTKRLILLLFVIQSILLGFLMVHSRDIISVMIIIFMNLVLMLLFCFKFYFELNDDFRLIGDSIFLFPLFYLLLL